MNLPKSWSYWVISEAALYFFLLYAQALLKVQGNLWITALILWILLNITIMFCPGCCKRSSIPK